MTQARDFAPVLDRLITRIIPGESPGLNPLGQPLPPTSETVAKVWAARRDYPGAGTSCESALSPKPNASSGLASSRFVVRAEGPAWAIGDIIHRRQRRVSDRAKRVGESRRARALA